MRPQLRGVVALGADALRAMGAVGLDEVRERTGGALPSSPDSLADARVMTELLGRPVRSVRLPGVEFESSNCQNFIVEVEEADGATTSLYAKLPATPLGPRLFANTVGYWALECHFCRHVAPQLTVRVPQVHAVAERGSRFVLLLEDLRSLPGARLFTNRDTAAGTTVEQARRCLSAFARLHASCHGWDRARQDALLPLSRHPFLSGRGRVVSTALNGTAIQRARQRAPELVSADLAATYRRTLEHWDTMLAHWYSGPLTLVHGDSHLANCFEYDGPGGREVGFLDFQGVHWAPGVRDVAYFLINSLEVGLLAGVERDLVDHYLGELAQHGVHLDRDETWRLYRSLAFQALVVGVVAVGLGGFTESENTVHTMLTRQVAAVERLGYADLLDQLTAQPPT